MSSSGLIYAVIVGAWAAYLVPMWLRRQDELNEARPTERFSTAIRLLAGRSALERRASRALGDDRRDDDESGAGENGATDGPPEQRDEAAPSDPERAARPASERSSDRSSDRSADRSAERRARLLARRRRMVTVLFLAFALGAVVAAVAGLAFLWVPAVPAALLTLYIGHLRRLERQRYEVKLDRVRAAQAAERLRDRERQRAEERPAPAAADDGEPARPQPAAEPARPHLRLAADPEPQAPRPTAAASALVEATDHEEWVDGMRERGAAGPDSWEPVPVPLPTYVTAPVAPRVSRGLDLSAPGTWTAGRPAEPRTTPLFDQYAAEAPADDYADRPRAANE